MKRTFLVLIFSLSLSVCLPSVADLAEDHVKNADELCAQGHFDRARTEYESALKSVGDAPHILERLGFIDFLQGDYARAIEYFREVIRLNPDRRRLMRAYTALAYYHLRRYSEVANILEELGPLNLLDLEQMRLLASDPPYQMEPQADPAILPFLQLDPLPVVQIQVASQDLFVFVDTGAGQLVLDPEFAREVNIQPVSRQETKGFAGGQTAEVSFGIAPRVSLGEVIIRRVPVCLLPTRRFSPDFGRRIDGIIGTEILRQFLPTLDYPNQRLILRRRDEQAGESLAAAAPTCVPFIIDGPHFMYAPCFINEKGPVLMYFDSGLADDQGASLSLNGAALADLGLPEPPLTEDGVGGGGAHQYGYVEIESVRVADLVQRQQKAVFSGGRGKLLSPAGYRTYGLLSHHFLKHYSWTIDFDRRVFLFGYTQDPGR